MPPLKESHRVFELASFQVDLNYLFYNFVVKVAQCPDHLFGFFALVPRKFDNHVLDFFFPQLAQVTELAPVLDQVINKLFLDELALFVVVGCEAAQPLEHAGVYKPVC